MSLPQTVDHRPPSTMINTDHCPLVQMLNTIEEKQMSLNMWSNGHQTVATERYLCVVLSSQLNKILGKGAYKVVWKAIDKEEGIEVAWNCLQVLNICSKFPDHEKRVL